MLESSVGVSSLFLLVDSEGSGFDSAFGDGVGGALSSSRGSVAWSAFFPFLRAGVGFSSDTDLTSVGVTSWVSSIDGFSAAAAALADTFFLGLEADFALAAFFATFAGIYSVRMSGNQGTQQRPLIPENL